MCDKIFSEIYDNKVWGKGSIENPLSGEGSGKTYTKEYRRFLKKFITNNEIKSVVDCGCGDWNFSRLIKWGDVQYTGLDVVKSVVHNNTVNYSTSNIKFQWTDFQSSKFKPIKADLYIIKDVIQHWPNKNIIKFIKKLIKSKKVKYILITNCSHQTNDNDIKFGDWRPLHPFKYPLNKFPLTILFKFSTKTTSLIKVY